MKNKVNIYIENVKVTVKCGAQLSDVKTDCCILALEEEANVTFEFNDKEYVIIYNEMKNCVKELLKKE